MAAKTILIIEDDQDLADMVASYLKAEGGFHPRICHDGVSGLRRALLRRPELILLDLQLPGLNGMEICRQLRKTPKTKSVPIIMISACTQEIDRIVCFEAGADDYVMKPFSPRELLLRVQAILWRVRVNTLTGTLQIGRIQINQRQNMVKVDGREKSLSRIEFRLLTTLAEHPGTFLSREEILEMVWNDTTASGIRKVDVHINRLRGKLGEAGSQVRTINAFGYTMDP